MQKYHRAILQGTTIDKYVQVGLLSIIFFFLSSMVVIFKLNSLLIDGINLHIILLSLPYLLSGLVLGWFLYFLFRRYYVATREVTISGNVITIFPGLSQTKVSNQKGGTINLNEVSRINYDTFIFSRLINYGVKFKLIDKEFEGRINFTGWDIKTLREITSYLKENFSNIPSDSTYDAQAVIELGESVQHLRERLEFK